MKNELNNTLNARGWNPRGNRSWPWAAALIAAMIVAPAAMADEPLGSTDDEGDVRAHTGQPIKPGAGGDRFGNDHNGSDSAMPGPLMNGGLVPWRYVLNGPRDSRARDQGPLSGVTLPTDLRTLSPMMLPAMPTGDGSAWGGSASPLTTIPAPGAVVVIAGAAVSALRRRR
ncbi:MAG: hypothetical protein SFY95_02010 [Planctomycetota bacterium]|nr:hypothetical protein [Planctomycetota bacterium]